MIAHPESSFAATNKLAVWPRAAASLIPISLGDLVAKALPSSHYVGWDHLQVASVRWLTEGIDYSETSTANRIGFARVRASGVITKMLRQRWEELSWSVEMSTAGNSKWGPTSIKIRPGFDNSRFKGKYICFGEAFEGCSFPISAINSPRLKLIKKCEIGEGGNVSVTMAATTVDGRRGTVVYSSSGGSGGYSNSVEISTLNPLEYCATYKDRGY